MTLDELKRELCGDNDRAYEQAIMASTIDLLYTKGLLHVWNYDMDGAPKDGTYVLTLSDWGANEAFWNGYTWITAIQSGSDEYAPLCCKPTAWMPLPSADGGE